MLFIHGDICYTEKNNTIGGIMLKNYITNPDEPEWLSLYNRSTSGAEKKHYLETGLRESNTAENHFRYKLWKKRFTKNGEITGYDFFLAQWMDLNYNLKHNSFILQKLRSKNIDKIANNLMLNTATDDVLQNILYQEFLNMILEYIELCQDDQNYQKILLGFKSMSKANLIYKIAYDIYSTGIGVIRLFQKEEKFLPLSKATFDAFQLAYPESNKEWLKAIHTFEKKYLS